MCHCLYWLQKIIVKTMIYEYALRTCIYIYILFLWYTLCVYIMVSIKFTHQKYKLVFGQMIIICTFRIKGYKFESLL